MATLLSAMYGAVECTLLNTQSFLLTHGRSARNLLVSSDNDDDGVRMGRPIVVAFLYRSHLILYDPLHQVIVHNSKSKGPTIECAHDYVQNEYRSLNLSYVPPTTDGGITHPFHYFETYVKPFCIYAVAVDCPAHSRELPLGLRPSDSETRYDEGTFHCIIYGVQRVREGGGLLCSDHEYETHMQELLYLGNWLKAVMRCVPES
jgi:hypothetical protein